MCLDTVVNYVNCMQEHIRKHTVVTPKRVLDGGKLMNNLSRGWTRLARNGGGNNHLWRVNRALVTNYSTIPPLIGLRKDHKANINNDPALGPKHRPLCPANIAPNAPLRNMIAMICKALADNHQEKAKPEVIISEELMYSFQETSAKILERIQRANPEKRK